MITFFFKHNKTTMPKGVSQITKMITKPSTVSPYVKARLHSRKDGLLMKACEFVIVTNHGGVECDLSLTITIEGVTYTITNRPVENDSETTISGQNAIENYILNPHSKIIIPKKTTPTILETDLDPNIADILL